MGLSGGMQQRIGQHSMVSQPFIKQGMPLGGMDGHSIHVVNGLDGMIYSHPKNSLKIITNPDNRMMQQQEGGSLGMQQAIVGVDMVGGSNFIEQNLDTQQHQNLAVTGQGNMFTYNKHFTGWLQPQNINTASNDQCQAINQSSLPSFNHLWSQFHQKQLGVVQHHQHINQYQQPPQFQNPIHQQQIQTQQFTASSFQALPGIQMIKMQHQAPQQKPQQIAVPVSIQSVQHLPSQFHCFSPSQVSLMSSNCGDKEPDRGNVNAEKGIHTSLYSAQPLQNSQSISSPCVEHKSTTAVTYTVSGPPKVTVTLDSLTHCETFPPNQFLGKSDMSFNPDVASSNSVSKGKTLKINSNLTSAVLQENCSHQRQWQAVQNQRTQYIPKPLFHTSSTGSSLERSSSESSNFSSPPYTFTPPSSTDSLFSPVSSQFPKVNDYSSGRTMAITPSPSAAQYLASSVTSSSQTVRETLPAGTLVATVPTPALSIASTCTTTVTTTVASSYHSVALTTTSVTSTTPCSRESTSMASVHSGVLLSSSSNVLSEHCNRSCSPAQKQFVSGSGAANGRKVKVPYSWQRKLENGIIEYLSPSGVVLQSLDQICRYLLSDTTCKCGLECPLQVDTFFSFDPEVGNQPWNSNTSFEDLGNLCNHKREIIALAAFHSSQAEAVDKSAVHGVQLGKKRQDRKSVSGDESLIVSPLKRLKTSITKAVNKQSMLLGNASQPSHVDSVISVDDKSSLVHSDLLFANVSDRASVSPSNSQGTHESGSSLGDFSGQPSPVGHPKQIPAFPRQVLDPEVDVKLKRSSPHSCTRASPNLNKQTFLMHHQQSVPGGKPHQGFSNSNSGAGLFDQGGGGRQTPLQNHVSGRMMPTNKPMPYHQGELQQQGQALNSSTAYFQQNAMYHNSPQLTQNASEGFPPAMWQGSCPSRSGPIPHHHSPRTFQPDIKFHHSNYNNPQANTFPKHSTPQQQQVVGLSWLDPKKTKTKRPKSKKDKQKQSTSIVDRSSPCGKSSSKPVKNAAIPSNAVSFFDNPTVFVEQQTAIINNSIASCQISCSSPTPYRSDSSNTKHITTFQSYKNLNMSNPHSEAGKSLGAIETSVGLDNLDIGIKTETDEQKSSTDLESNRSFSDTAENNDSAYLSQTGSDQERSDTISGSDSCVETKSKCSDVYDFNMSEDRESKPTVAKQMDIVGSEPSESDGELASPPRPSSALSKNLRTVKAAEKKTINKLKPRLKATPNKRELTKLDVELLKKNWPGNLNGDLSQLLASNNWNIPALQQVLAQYNAGDPGQLNAAIQQAVSQAASAGVEFPASNLLSAAARAQLNTQYKDHVTVSLSSNVVNTPAMHTSKNDMFVSTSPCATSHGELKTAVSNTLCGSVVNPLIPHLHQPHSCIQQLPNNSNLIGNMMQLQQLASGNFAMNMLLPACGQGQTYNTSDSIHTGTYTAEHDLKSSGQGNMNPLMTQGILATVSQSPEMGSQLKLSVASVIPSGLGPQGTQDTMLLNSFGPRMIVNNPMPPVSVSVVTNVTKSLAQVVPTIGINHTVFSTQQVAQQLINSQQGTAQIINTAGPPPGTHVINSSPQGAQLVSSAPQGTQFVSSSGQGAQLVNNTSQATQLMNALSVQSLNNQLLITNPIQQVSPSNSLSQLSPAMAAQLLAQGQQQLQQMSPSFLQSQIQKQTQNSMLGGQNMFASVSLPTLTVTSDHCDAIANSIPQSSLISSIQNGQRPEDQMDKPDDMKGNSMGNPSMYASTSQPVFVIPQGNSNPVMQVIGTSQQIASAPGLSAEINNISQIFNPITVQQMMNTVSLGGVHQQHQQPFQILQLQQLLQQIQNQGQNLHGISLPINQSSSPSQATLGPQTVVVPQQSLQLNSVMDINTLHSSLSPVAQGYQNQLSPAAAQLQHISSALTVHQVTPVNTGGAVGVIHNTGVQGLMQAHPKSLSSVVATVQQSQQIATDQVNSINKTQTINPSGIMTQECSGPSASVQSSINNASKMSSVSSAGTKLLQTGKPSKSKTAKSKKSETKKVVDPETEKNEEDIVATVQQILAQAVQQQKELILAAKNQPPPAPKGKSKKSQLRSKSNLGSKEHDLGKLASISDEPTFLKSEGFSIQDKLAFDITSKCSETVDLSHGHLAPVSNSSQSEVIQSANLTNHLKAIHPSAQMHSSSHVLSTGVTTHSITNFVEQTLNETSNLVTSNVKKSAISLKDHLSSIISKDKDGSKNKASGVVVQRPARGKMVIESRATHAQSLPVLNGEVSAAPKLVRKPVK